MTALEAEPEWPVGRVYWSPRSIGYQLDGIARAWILRQMMVVWDLGTGKSHLGLAIAGQAFQDDEADLVLIICKKNKLADDEWPGEIRKFTTISDFAVYHGPRRREKLALHPRVLVTTYETVRADVAIRTGVRKMGDGPLMDFLRGKRIIVIYDEIVKLGNRSSGLYKAHHHMLAQLRKEHPDMRVYGLTGTPMERDWENAFNEMRLIWPQGMTTVKAFEEQCIRKRVFVPTGPSGRVGFERIIWNDAGVRQFAATCAPRLLRKRKTDPDVVSQFPPMTEDFVRCEMRPDQHRLYQALEDLAWDDQGDHVEVPGLSMMLRLFAGHPRAIARAAENGRSKLAKVMDEELHGELMKCSSAKTEELLEYLAQITGGQGDKVMIFTFFARTVLPVLREILEPKYPVFVYDGSPESDRQKAFFRQYEGGAILLSSDAGSDGINVPEASYIMEYEGARTFATRTQRFGRGHRLGRTAPLTCLTFTLAGSVEESRVMKRVFERNQQQDIFLGDEEAEGHLSAEDRREMFGMARKRKPRGVKAPA